MPLPRVLEPEVMSGAEEAVEYDEMDFSATDRLFAQRAAELASRARRRRLDRRSRLRQRQNSARDVSASARRRPRVRRRNVDRNAGRCRPQPRPRRRSPASPPGEPPTPSVFPSPTDPSDMVTSNSLIHHIPDPRAVFAGNRSHCPRRRPHSDPRPGAPRKRRKPSSTSSKPTPRHGARCSAPCLPTPSTPR